MRISERLTIAFKIPIKMLLLFLKIKQHLCVYSNGHYKFTAEKSLPKELLLDHLLVVRGDTIKQIN